VPLCTVSIIYASTGRGYDGRSQSRRGRINDWQLLLARACSTHSAKKKDGGAHCLSLLCGAPGI